MATVTVNHNYGGPGALRYQTLAGAPVQNAVIRIYYQTDYDQGNLDTPLAITQTDAAGNWVDSVVLTSGYTYAVQFFLEGLYGPDRVNIVV